MTEFFEGTAEEVLDELCLKTGEHLAKMAFLFFPAGDAPKSYFRAIDAAAATRIDWLIEKTGGDVHECAKARQAVAETLRSRYKQLAVAATSAGHA